LLGAGGAAGGAGGAGRGPRSGSSAALGGKRRGSPRRLPAPRKREAE
jgi:hypothetical protein